MTGDLREFTIDNLVITDPEVIDVLARYPADERLGVVEHMLSVGARGLRSMGLSVGLDDIDARITRSLTAAATEAQHRLATTLGDIVERTRSQLDHTHLDSPAAKTLAELESWRTDLASVLDPDRPDSSPGRLLDMLQRTIGTEGEFEARLRLLMDPSGADSAVAGLAALLTARITEVRDLILENRGRREEAQRGTQKGIEFEDILDRTLRTAAAPHGWVVERTGAVAGSLHADSKVGDFVIDMTDGHRIVVEAKKSARIGLTGHDGILAELDRAMANRHAEFSVCVSAEDAFPDEVGSFGVYGNRVLVVDDGDGGMLDVALRWARLSLAAARDGGPRADVDRDLVADRLQRLRSLAKRFSGTKRSLTQISTSVGEVRESLDAIRVEVLDHLNDLEHHLLDETSNVVRLTPVESL